MSTNYNDDDDCDDNNNNNDDDDDEHVPERLNPEQRDIFDHVFAARDDCFAIVVQAGPGTGKTFTLTTIAGSWSRSPVNVVVYKHDLLHGFRRVSHLHTVAKFFMSMLALNFKQYEALERQFTNAMSNLEFVTCVIGLLARARLPPGIAPESLLIFDEYLVAPKPLFLVSLLLLRRHRINVILCGDKNQLENVHDSRHTNAYTSYDIAEALCDRVFRLVRNERCSDRRYNEIIEHVSRYSSSRYMDAYAYTAIAAVFPRQLCGLTRYEDTHLAATHRELARTVHMLVVRDRLPCSFYYIDDSRSRDRDCNAKLPLTTDGLRVPEIVTRYESDRAPDKFLPYLPLVLGARYYAREHSERRVARLVAVDENGLLDLRRERDGRLEESVGKNSRDEVIFEPHRDALLGGARGHVYNYPIYPANVMTIHKCQGCTITDPIDVNFGSTTYRGMYVALSRVRSPDQIRRIVVPNAIAHLVTAIANVPEMTDGDRGVTADALRARLSPYFYYYDLADPSSYADAIDAFFACDDATERARMRDDILRRVSTSERRRVIDDPLRDRAVTRVENPVLAKCLQYSELFFVVSRLGDARARNAWFHEFVARRRDFAFMRGDSFAKIDSSAAINTLQLITDYALGYGFDRTTRQYLESFGVGDDRNDDASPLLTRIYAALTRDDDDDDDDDGASWLRLLDELILISEASASASSSASRVPLKLRHETRRERRPDPTIIVRRRCNRNK